MKMLLASLLFVSTLPALAGTMVLDCPRTPLQDITAVQVFEDNGAYTLRQVYGSTHRDSVLDQRAWEARRIRLKNYFMTRRSLEKHGNDWWVRVQSSSEDQNFRIDCKE